MSTWNSMKAAIAAVAPTLGAALGGPFGVAAGRMVSKALTGREGASANEVHKALQAADADKLVKLKELDNEYKLQMQKLGITRDKLEQLDRDSARHREIEMMRWGHRDLTPPLLAFTVTIGFFGVVIAIFFIPIVQGMREIADVLIGALGTAWVTIVSYYFGSSFNAEKSNEIRAQETL